MQLYLNIFFSNQSFPLEYIPYVFQVLAQMLELQSQGQVPAQYRTLLPFLLTPAIWQQKGSIPGLVRLLKAFLSRDAAQMLAAGQVASVLAVVQQRLIPSKLNDAWGFELVQSVVQHVKPYVSHPKHLMISPVLNAQACRSDLGQYMKPVIVTLLTRMQSNKTDKFVYHFARFMLFTMAIDVEGLSPDFLIRFVEEIQPQCVILYPLRMTRCIDAMDRLWSQILSNFIIPQAPTVPHRDRKLAVIGMTKMLTRSSYMLQEPSVQQW